MSNLWSARSPRFFVESLPVGQSGGFLSEKGRKKNKKDRRKSRMYLKNQMIWDFLFLGISDPLSIKPYIQGLPNSKNQGLWNQSHIKDFFGD